MVSSKIMILGFVFYFVIFLFLGEGLTKISLMLLMIHFFKHIKLMHFMQNFEMDYFIALTYLTSPYKTAQKNNTKTGMFFF